MKAIYKYKLHPTRPTKLTTPVESEFLHLGVQHNRPVMWMMVNTDPKAEKLESIVMPIMTGQEVSDDLIEWGFVSTLHIGTVQLTGGYTGGNYVVHYFDVTDAKEKIISDIWEEGKDE